MPVDAPIFDSYQKVDNLPWLHALNSVVPTFWQQIKIADIYKKSYIALVPVL